jgi:hypothetical protein
MARERRRPMSPENAIARGVTRRASPAPGTIGEQVQALEALYGREGARARLGVHERTMRRYRAGGTPTKANAEKIARQARLASRRGRRGEAQLRNRGAKVRMSGNLGLNRNQQQYRRHRTITVNLTPEQTSEITDLWLAGDDEGAVEALREALGENYLANFDFEDLTQLEFLRREEEE